MFTGKAAPLHSGWWLLPVISQCPPVIVLSSTDRYAIIADDLTGAGDVGVQFSYAGLRTRTLCDARLPVWPAGIDTVVVDTHSRGLAPTAAYAAVAAAAQVLHAAGARLVYKKIDSTLRGALGAELDAALDVSGATLAVVCPAYPANGRTLVDGILAVDGQPVAQTPIGRDPIAPVRESHLPTLLAQQSHRRVIHLAQPSTAVALEAQLADIIRDGGGLVVCDAGDDAALATIVEGVDRLAMSCAACRFRRAGAAVGRAVGGAAMPASAGCVWVAAPGRAGPGRSAGRCRRQCGCSMRRRSRRAARHGAAGLRDVPWYRSGRSGASDRRAPGARDGVRRPGAQDWPHWGAALPRWTRRLVARRLAEAATAALADGILCGRRRDRRRHAARSAGKLGCDRHRPGGGNGARDPNRHGGWWGLRRPAADQQSRWFWRAGRLGAGHARLVATTERVNCEWSAA